MVVRHGRSADGPVDVLIGFKDDPETVTAALPLLELLGPRLGRVTLARLVPYESVDPGDSSPAKMSAVFSVELCSVFLDRYDPGLVLVPGPWPNALVDHARREAYKVLFLVVDGSPSTLRGLDNLAGTVPTVLITDQSRREMP